MRASEALREREVDEEESPDYILWYEDPDGDPVRAEFPRMTRDPQWVIGHNRDNSRTWVPVHRVLLVEEPPRPGEGVL